MICSVPLDLQSERRPTLEDPLVGMTVYSPVPGQSPSGTLRVDFLQPGVWATSTARVEFSLLGYIGRRYIFKIAELTISYLPIYGWVGTAGCVSWSVHRVPSLGDLLT